MPRHSGIQASWYGILRRTLRSVSNHRLVDEAGAVAFFTTLALVPALTALVSLYGLFAAPVAIADHLARLVGLLPADGVRIVEDQVRRLVARERSTLGLGAVLGLVASLRTANRAMKAMFKALNTVHGTCEGRGFVRRTRLTLTFTLGGILFTLLAIGTVVAFPVALRILGLGSLAELLLRMLRWPLLFGAVALFLACLYRFTPSGFLIWLWLSAAVVLVGGALNAEIGRGSGVDRPMDGTSGEAPGAGERGRP